MDSSSGDHTSVQHFVPVHPIVVELFSVWTKVVDQLTLPSIEPFFLASMTNKHSHLAVFSPQQCPQKYFLTVENINQYFICHPSSCDHCQSSHQVAVLRAPSPHHCRDVFIFQTQPYSLFRFVEPPMFTFDDDLYRPQYSSLLCIYILWCVSCNIAGTVRLVYSLLC